MNKEELVKAVAASAKLSQKDTAEIIGATIEVIPSGGFHVHMMVQRFSTETLKFVTGG